MRNTLQYGGEMFVPVYHELVDKMKTSIRSGDLSGRLPGVRVLGKQFGVNPATVSKALRVLEEKGMRGAVMDAVLAAYNKTKEMGKGIQSHPIRAY